MSKSSKYNNYFSQIRELETQYAIISSNLVSGYPKPLNTAKEKKKFFRKIKKNEIYNPQMKYEERRYCKDSLKQLEELKKSINLDDDIFNLKYLLKKKIEEGILNIEMYENWGTKRSCEICAKTKGKPTKTDFQKAMKFILNYERGIIKFKRLTVKRLGRELIKEVHKLTGEKINVEFEELANKMLILANQKKVIINPQEQFRSIDLERLKVHEIQTHFMRYHNATKLDFCLLQTGTPNYILTEEGLAVYMEYKHDVLSRAQMYIYAGRVVATYLCQEKSFYEIYNYLVNIGFKEEDAFKITLRSKRNLNDTSQIGGYTRDYIYFVGFHKVKKHIEKNPEDFKKLFIGKIGLKDLKTLKKFINYVKREEKKKLREKNSNY